MPYIGKQPTVGNFQVCDAISVVNGQAAYTMQVGSANVTPESANHMLVSLNGVVQKPGSSFTISGSTITFASNLATGDVIDFIILLGDVLNIGTPSDDTVATASIQANAVTAAKLNNDVISGLTALGAEPADTDEFLISDAGTIKRLDYSYIKGGGKVLQVIHGTDETSRETTSTSYASLTLNASITPSATSSKVLILVSLAVSSAFDEKYGYFTLFRDSSDVGNSDGSGFFYTFDSDGSGDVYMAGSITHLDSPSTTSETTYTLYGKATSGGKARINTNGGRSTITLIEIGA